MESNFLMPRFNHVQNNVTAVFIDTLSIAKPSTTFFYRALHNTFSIMNATVSAGMTGQIIKVIGLNFCAVQTSHRFRYFRSAINNAISFICQIHSSHFSVTIVSIVVLLIFFVITATTVTFKGSVLPAREYIKCIWVSKAPLLLATDLLLSLAKTTTNTRSSSLALIHASARVLRSSASYCTTHILRLRIRSLILLLTTINLFGRKAGRILRSLRNRFSFEISPIFLLLFFFIVLLFVSLPALRRRVDLRLGAFVLLPSLATICEGGSLSSVWLHLY